MITIKVKDMRNLHVPVFTENFRLQAMKREIAMRELKLLDAVRRKFMTHQQKVKDMEIQRLDDELERKVNMRNAIASFLDFN